MRGKKNSSLVLLGVFTLGITQSYVVEALTETSANLAKEINDESKQQNIDVQQGTDDQNVDSKDENLLCINDDKNTKNISRVPKSIWGGIATSVAGLLAAIFVKKMLDSKRNIDSEQNNSNKNNNDSERNKEIEKDPDDQELKSPDSEFIPSLSLVIVLGAVIIFVIAIVIVFVCEDKRENEINKYSEEKKGRAKEINKYREEKKRREEIIKFALDYRISKFKDLAGCDSWKHVLLMIYKKIEKNLGEYGLALKDLADLFKDADPVFLKKLLEIPNFYFNKIFLKKDLYSIKSGLNNSEKLDNIIEEIKAQILKDAKLERENKGFKDSESWGENLLKIYNKASKAPEYKEDLVNFSGDYYVANVGLEFYEIIELLKEKNSKFLETLLNIPDKCFYMMFWGGRYSTELLLKKEYEKPFCEFISGFFDNKIKDKTERYFKKLFNRYSKTGIKALMDFATYIGKPITDLNLDIIDLLPESPCFINFLLTGYAGVYKEEIDDAIVKKARNFALAILTGDYKGKRKKIKLKLDNLYIMKEGTRNPCNVVVSKYNKEGKIVKRYDAVNEKWWYMNEEKSEFVFGSSPKENLSKIYFEYEIRGANSAIYGELAFIRELIEKYDRLDSEHQQAYDNQILQAHNNQVINEN